MSHGSLSNDAATPLLRQYREIKSQYPDAILLFRLGDFYEMFYDDAIIASKLLDITLTSRNRNDPNPVPLCGVPFHSVEPYIAKLLEFGKKVAVCDQMEDPALAKGIVRREVTRVVTPGVVTDGVGLVAESHNFLAGIEESGGTYGLALADASTGFFQASEFPSSKELIEELCRSAPRELLFAKRGEASPTSALGLESRLPSMLSTALPQADFEPAVLARIEGGAALARDLPVAGAAAAGVLSYLTATQFGKIGQITRILRGEPKGVMRLDEASMRNLELTRTVREGQREGSLLWAIDRSSTATGSRMLRRWLLYPLTDPRRICARLDAVEAIVQELSLLRGLPEVLRRIYDIERLASRTATAQAHARDLVAIRDSLGAAGELRTLLAGQQGLLGELSAAIDPCPVLAAAIGDRLVDDPPLTLRDGGFIRSGVSPMLDEIRFAIAHGKETIAAIEAQERAATGIGSLKVRFNKVFGYYLEVTNANRDKVPEHYIRKQTLANAERYITPELKEYEEKVLGGEERARALEYELFTMLREEVAAATPILQRNAEAIASIDALTSLARIAAEYDYVKPAVDDGLLLDIREGRHPIVERMNTSSRFVPNDVRLDGEELSFLMVTGPNMAGKSTVMRQTALIVLLAQMGSFVPARAAHIGVVDRIFTRVGASDALAAGQSTFMVEMSEAATILREATQRSLVIIDEIGRGTSTFDGLAIAWAVAEDLHDRIRARTLFATHYHELTELALTKPRIQNFHVAVREWNGQVIFLRRLVPGATSRSYGIAVASLAGLPAPVIGRATEVLANLEEGELDEVGRPRLASSHTPPAADPAAQYQLFQAHPRIAELEERLRSLDTDALTPLQALTLLHEFKSSMAR
jgi:DNA mismatch repair protein MutS